MRATRTEEIRGNELIGLEVVLLPENRVLGGVADLLVDYRQHQVVGLLLGRAWSARAKVIPFQSVERLEASQISVCQSRPSRELQPLVQEWLAQPRLFGRPLFLSDDTPLGILVDVLMEKDGGQIVSYLVGATDNPERAPFLRVSPRRLPSLLSGVPRPAPSANPAVLGG